MFQSRFDIYISSYIKKKESKNEMANSRHRINENIKMKLIQNHFQLT